MLQKKSCPNGFFTKYRAAFRLYYSTVAKIVPKRKSAAKACLAGNKVHSQIQIINKSCMPMQFLLIIFSLLPTNCQTAPLPQTTADFGGEHTGLQPPAPIAVRCSRSVHPRCRAQPKYILQRQYHCLSLAEIS